MNKNETLFYSFVLSTFLQERLLLFEIHNALNRLRFNKLYSHNKPPISVRHTRNKNIMEMPALQTYQLYFIFRFIR